jgi:hypothetical protein
MMSDGDDYEYGPETDDQLDDMLDAYQANAHVHNEADEMRFKRQCIEDARRDAGRDTGLRAGHNDDIDMDNNTDDDDFYIPPAAELESLKLLNEVESAALEFVSRHAELASLQSHSILRRRVAALLGGRTSADTVVRRLLRHVRDDASIVVPMSVDEITRMADFPRHTSKHDLYADSKRNKGDAVVKDGPHPVRALLDVANRLSTVHALHTSYVELRHVRLRTTASREIDSQPYWAMCRSYTHILEALSDHELASVVYGVFPALSPTKPSMTVLSATKPSAIALSATTTASPTTMRADTLLHKVDVHGALSWSKNVASVVVPRSARNDAAVRAALDHLQRTVFCPVVYR